MIGLIGEFLFCLVWVTIWFVGGFRVDFSFDWVLVDLILVFDCCCC
jgi:hypothetical protein